MVPINQVVQIDCNDIILRLRPNIQTSLSPEETPGLEDLLNCQGRRIPSRTKRGALELVSPSKPKIPRLNLDAPPLPSLLETLSSDPTDGALPQLLAGTPAVADCSTPHQPETPRRNVLNVEPPKSRFPSSRLAKDILSGLEEVNSRNGRKVGERYEKVFGHPYARSSLNALRANAVLVKPVFDLLAPSIKETVTWGALIQTAKTSAPPQMESFQSTPARTTAAPIEATNVSTPTPTLADLPDEMPGRRVIRPLRAPRPEVTFSLVPVNYFPLMRLSQQPVGDISSPPLAPPQLPQPFPVNFTADPPFNNSTLQFPPLSPLASPTGIFNVLPLSLMCPFCDETLPGTIFSEDLMKILDKINLHGGTRRDPTLENPNHLAAVRGLTASVEFCVQHRHEKQYQVALNRGWPTRPDFIDLPDQVIGLADRVRNLVVTGLFDIQSPHRTRLTEHLERARRNMTIGNFGGSVSCG